jgi:hypothetical protein
MTEQFKDRDDIREVLSFIDHARDRARALRDVDRQTLKELLFHLDCSAVSTMRLQAETWIEVEESP